MLGLVTEEAEGVLAHLAGVSVAALGAALAFDAIKLLARARAWQNIVRAAYPENPLRFGDALGAFLAGVGVDAVVPARAGELLRLGLVKRRLPEATLAGLASTLLVESACDVVLALLVGCSALVLAPHAGLPAAVLTGGPFARRPLLDAAVLAGLALGACALAVALRRRLRVLWHDVRRGFAVLASPVAYARHVASWQGLGWGLRLASIYWFLVAFHLSAGVIPVLVVASVQLLASAIPLAPGGAGAQQAMLVGALSASAAKTLGFGVGVQAATTLLDVVLGAAALGLLTGSIRGPAAWRAPRATPAPARRGEPTR